jgi:hypothetical protein
MAKLTIDIRGSNVYGSFWDVALRVLPTYVTSDELLKHFYTLAAKQQGFAEIYITDVLAAQVYTLSDCLSITIQDGHWPHGMDQMMFQQDLGQFSVCSTLDWYGGLSIGTSFATGIQIGNYSNVTFPLLWTTANCINYGTNHPMTVYGNW